MLLRGSNATAASSSDSSPYPTITVRLLHSPVHRHSLSLQFEIPEAEQKSSWILYVSILTESDPSGRHYFHESKGIFLVDTKTEHLYRQITGSNLTNPHRVYLSADDIARGQYVFVPFARFAIVREIHFFSLRLRVCNVRDLPHRRRLPLRAAPGTRENFLYEDQRLSTTLTSDDLQFSSGQFHIGCFLVERGVVRDRCISALAMEGRRKEPGRWSLLMITARCFRGQTKGKWHREKTATRGERRGESS